MPKHSDIFYTVENLYYKNKVNNFSIYTIFLILILLILGSLPLIKVDISTQSKGIIKSFSNNVPILSIISGRITYINIHNNQNIKKGDTLFSVSTNAVDAEILMNQDLQTNLKSVMADLNQISLGKTHNFKTEEIQKEYFSYIQKYNQLAANLELATKEFKRNKNLFQDGVIPAADFEKAESEFKAAIASLSNFKEQQYASWQTKKREITQQLKSYAGNINQLKASKANYYSIAPISGSIVNFSGIQVGSLINDSQPIAEISSNEDLQVENKVSPNDIGLIHIGQKVFFQIDAYNYNQWGMAQGNVIDIDQNITFQDNGQGYFKVWCKMDKNYLQLKNGYKGNINKGMTLTSRFLINRRTLWQLLYDKVDNWLNPKIKH